MINVRDCWLAVLCEQLLEVGGYGCAVPCVSSDVHKLLGGTYWCFIIALIQVIIYNNNTSRIMNLNKHPVPVHNKMSATQAGPKDICMCTGCLYKHHRQSRSRPGEGSVSVHQIWSRSRARLARTGQSRPDILPKLPLLCQPGALEPASFWQIVWRRGGGPHQ